METEIEAGVPGVYRERAERRWRKRSTGETRGDGWQRTEEDEHLLRLATRYSTLTLHQAAYACWDGRIEAARRRVRLMTEAGLLHRTADVRGARTVLWPTERGARVMRHRAERPTYAPGPDGTQGSGPSYRAATGAARDPAGRLVTAEAVALRNGGGSGSTGCSRQ